jgi:hypothetical protein
MGHDVLLFADATRNGSRICRRGIQGIHVQPVTSMTPIMPLSS